MTVSTHSRPKAAGTDRYPAGGGVGVSTHSRPKAAGFYRAFCQQQAYRFNSQPPEGGWSFTSGSNRCQLEFQLTAARRRLGGRYALR